MVFMLDYHLVGTFFLTLHKSKCSITSTVCATKMWGVVLGHESRTDVSSRRGRGLFHCRTVKMRLRVGLSHTNTSTGHYVEVTENQAVNA